MKFARSLLSSRSVVRVARLAAVVGMAGGALVFSGCSSLSVTAGRQLETIVALAPAPVLVARGQELRTADAAAAQTTGAQAFIGAGDSMQPIYASGTAIVVTPCDYTQLRPGLSVVYVNSDGRGVAHALVEATHDGWVVQGVNNPEPDANLVTARNLVGVITQAYAASDTPLRREIAARNALKLAPVAGAKSQVALSLSKAGHQNMVQAWQ
jgi:hypothetical protein